MQSPDDPHAQEDQEQPFYLTPPAPCPYLPDRMEQRILTFIEPAQTGLSAPLLAAGFRRSQNMFYRPHCPSCSACMSVRMPVADFAPDKNFRRTLRRNDDIQTHTTAAQSDDALYDLFHRYQATRHTDGEMAAMTAADLKAMIEDQPGTARLMHCTKDGKIIGVMLFDETDTSVSAIYSFFDPDQSKRSLGTYMVLKLVEYAQNTGRDYLYLGYWIRQSPKMAYKSRFQPLQILIKNEWKNFKSISF